MELTIGALLIVIFMFILMIAGMEIAMAMGVASTIGLMFLVDKPVSLLASASFEVMNSFSLTAIPLFTFMGGILFNTGVVRSLFDAIDILISGLPGGVAHSVIAANAVFGAMSGSSVAAGSLFGKTCYPNMKRLGYADSLSLGVLCSGGTLAVLIPPSLILIVYGGWENISVARLFAGGLIPGILLTIMLMLTVLVLVKINPTLAPSSIRHSVKERLASLKNVFPFVVLIVLILGTIFGGIMTPTESAGLGAIFSILLALAYGKMTFKVIKDSLADAVTITVMVAFLLFTARVLGQIFHYTGALDIVSGFFLHLPGSKYVAISLIFFMYLILGCFFDSLSMMVLTLPFVSPVIANLGFNPIWFGVVFVVLAEIGLLTPPFGLNLFVIHAVIPEHELMTIVRSSLPFMIPMLLLIILLVIFPQLVLWLPEIMY